MGEFQQHPDGMIFVRGEAGKYYADTPENFVADFGGTFLPPALPDGADDHVYTQGKRHAYMGGGNIIAGGPVPWPEGDQLTADLDAGLAAPLERNPPPPPPPEPDPAAATKTPQMEMAL